MQALKKLIKWVLMFFGALVVLGIVVTACSGDKKTDTSSSNEQAQKAVPEAQQTAKETKVEAGQPKVEIQEAEKPQEKQASVGLTAQQMNAVRSAEQYISFSGFSRDGLINQLSSSYGDGYNKKDATIAVDSLNVDWNEQAVKSAKQYLSMSGFSCDGLINQLSSDAGDKYTKSQATYGAKQAGACS